MNPLSPADLAALKRKADRWCKAYKYTVVEGSAEGAAWVLGVAVRDDRSIPTIALIPVPQSRLLEIVMPIRLNGVRKELKAMGKQAVAEMLRRSQIMQLNANIDYRTNFESDGWMPQEIQYSVLLFVDDLTGQRLLDAIKNVKNAYFRLVSSFNITAQKLARRDGPKLAVPDAMKEEDSKPSAPSIDWNRDAYPFVKIDDIELWQKLEDERKGDEPLQDVLRRVLKEEDE